MLNIDFWCSVAISLDEVIATNDHSPYSNEPTYPLTCSIQLQALDRGTSLESQVLVATAAARQGGRHFDRRI